MTMGLPQMIGLFDDPLKSMVLMVLAQYGIKSDDLYVVTSMDFRTDKMLLSITGSLMRREDDPPHTP